MELSIFLAKVIGLYFLAFVIILCFRRKQTQSTLMEIFTSPGTLALSGLITLLAGILLAVSHSVWEFNWRGLITLVGYITLTSGILRLGFPNATRRFARYSLESGKGCIICLLMLIVALYLIYSGFTA
jgi:hypothetical protein